ncbi:MAG: (d)CMP kinase [Ferrovum sp.]|nr:(d)CMP kinase [Ferrovum sp.]NDU87204.1 (d)CMP kinase [Ferrovum sp.]
MIPVIAIDGPSASGKGTVAQRVAQTLGYHYLDSGSLYRLTALWAERVLGDERDELGLAQLAQTLPVEFEGEDCFLNGQCVTEEIRTESCGLAASRISGFPGVREALLQLQRSYLRAPGLVADGRDMGSVVFPQAQLKVFLTADAEVRAERRVKQLISKGIHVIIEDVVKDLRERDARDMARSVAPLTAVGAWMLDTSALTIPEAVARILDRYHHITNNLV